MIKLEVESRLDEFKEYFVSDFDFSTVSDFDTKMSFNEAKLKLSYCLRGNKYAFFCLIAHLLCLRLQKGDETEFNTGIVSAEKLDNLMVHYAVPDQFLKNPRYIFFLSTKYGIQYLNYLAFSNTQFVGLVRGRSQPD